MSGNLTTNKIMGAVLATGVVAMFIGIGSDAIYGTKAPEKPGYLIEVPEEVAGGDVEEALPIDWGTVLPTADIAAGEAAFNTKCTSCHTIAAGGPNLTGPNLNGVVGRAMASHAGFAYSTAMVDHKNDYPNWSYDALDHFLKAPGREVRGTKMSFVGLKKDEERINVIAYMHTQGSMGYPIPAPDPARQPGAATPATEGEAATPSEPPSAADAPAAE